MAGYFVGVYWGPRLETRAACAQRISVFLSSLAMIDSTLGNWFRKGSTRDAARISVGLTVSDIEPLLKSQRRDIGGEAMTALGFNFAAWNGGGSLPASVSATCGASALTLQNSAVLSFEPGPSLSPELLQQILHAAVEAFEPTDGLAASNELLSSHPGQPPWALPAKLQYHETTGFISI